MTQPQSMVANAADRKQVEHAGRKERRVRQRELDDLRALLKFEEGRRFLWRLLGWSGYLENPTHTRGDQTHQNIGRGDCGRFLLSEIMQADESKFLQMQQEAWRDARNQQVEAEAIRTKSADPQSQDDDAHS